MKLKCYLRCFMIQYGILNENNNIDVEKVLRYLPHSMQQLSKKILNQCKLIQAENVCDRAFRIATCYIKAQPEILKIVSFT
ncbi:general odorant-binding protein 56h [Monomorium pharaonis]|uniref:general odorant-binding protein 56h n=1 Tax=Monomorium pharaonis TaxID=307658 RepID=UPI00174670A7|nr:general odorant-binding protein 56h [Monomorium pharaonis]